MEIVENALSSTADANAKLEAELAKAMLSLPAAKGAREASSDSKLARALGV